MWTENEGDRYLKRRRESFHNLSIGGCGIHSSSSCEVVLWNHLTHVDSSKHSPVSSSWPSISYVIHPNKLLFLLKNYFELNKCTQNSLVDLIPTEPSKTQTRYYFWSNLSKFQGPRALTCGSSHSMYLYRRKDTTSVYLRDVLLWGQVLIWGIWGMDKWMILFFEQLIHVKTLSSLRLNPWWCKRTENSTVVLSPSAYC